MRTRRTVLKTVGLSTRTSFEACAHCGRFTESCDSPLINFCMDVLPARKGSATPAILYIHVACLEGRLAMLNSSAQG